jgi:hypothetical protein
VFRRKLRRCAGVVALSSIVVVQGPSGLELHSCEKLSEVKRVRVAPS